MYALEILEKLIGNTPMIGIKYRFQEKEGVIYVKCEHYNFTGSIKDRIALKIFKEAVEEGKLKPGYTIVEATSGNTGISVSALGKFLGCKVKIFMPNWLSKERKCIIKSFGAKITTVSKSEGGFLKSIAMAKEVFQNNRNTFWVDQFANVNNVKAHEETGGEIVEQLQRKNLTIDAFIAGVGTGGTIIGVGRALRKHNKNIKIHPLEPKESPTLTTGYKVGSHRIQGISDEFIPEIFTMDKTDEIIQVSDGDAIIMAQKLAQTLGLGVGISSGANFIGAIKLQQKYGMNSIVATVFPDDNKKYLTTDLCRKEPIQNEHFAHMVELLEITETITIKN